MPRWRKLDYKTFERDPFDRRRPGDYETPAAAVQRVQEWFDGPRDEPAGEAPAGFEVVDRAQQGDRVSIVFLHGGEDYAVEMQYSTAAGGPGPRAFPVPAEVAYRLALDRDDRERARGKVIYNERHPRSAP